MKSYRTPPDVAVNHDHSIDSNNLPCSSNVRRLPADVVGRSSSRFATTKMTFFVWWKA